MPARAESRFCPVYKHDKTNKMAAPMDRGMAVLVLTKNAQKMRLLLEEDGYWNSLQKLHRLDGNIIAVPVKHDILSAVQKGELTDDLPDFAYNGSVLASWNYRGIPCKLASVSLPLSKKRLTLSPHQRLINALMETLKKVAVPIPAGALREIPNTWEKHGDLILLPQMSFQSDIWSYCPNLWETVARILGGHRVARKGRVVSDDFRSPQVELLLGSDGWVEHRDNGISYTYNVRHCMFSIGNITEKLRVASFDCTEEIVVDLYAGIGYFTLPYLVHAKARLVHACEWNPDAVTALRRNVALNKVENRCVVHHGDNKEVCPKGVADRVNLGLIPSSEEGWPVGCAALKPRHGGILHIHGNVTSKDIEYEEDIKQCLSNESRSVCDAQGTFLPDDNLDTINRICKTVSSTNEDEHCQRCSPQNHPNRTENCVTWQHKTNACWDMWAENTARRIKELLVDIHGGVWDVNVIHVQHVKSYAPHVDHVVADIRCLPKVQNGNLC